MISEKFFIFILIRSLLFTGWLYLLEKTKCKQHPQDIAIQKLKPSQEETYTRHDSAKYKWIWLFKPQMKTSHKSEYTPHISAIILVYLLKGQYYRNETWIYFRVVNVQLVLAV